MMTLYQQKQMKRKLKLLITQIDYILQLQKVEDLNLIPSAQNIDKVLLDVAKSNNITIDELSNFDDIDLIKKEISEKLSILNLTKIYYSRYSTPKGENPIGMLQ
jgi:hypothetical protein